MLIPSECYPSHAKHGHQKGDPAPDDDLVPITELRFPAQEEVAYHKRGAGVIAGAHSVQRVLGTIRGSRPKGSHLSGFLKLLIPFVLVLPGVIAHALHPNLSKADMAYPRLVSELLPVGLRGLVLAGLIAILMSSAIGDLWFAGSGNPPLRSTLRR